MAAMAKTAFISISAVGASAILASAFVPGCNLASGVDDYAFDRACADAIVAATEDCSTEEVDENCDGILRCEIDDWWKVSFGEVGTQDARAVAFDLHRNVVVAGFHQGAVSFDSAAQSVGEDIFIAKLADEGRIIWAKRFGADGNQRVEAVAVDNEDNILIAGSFQGTVTFGGDELKAPDDEDVFVAKLTRGGNHLWSKSFPSLGVQRARAVAVDSEDNVLVAGAFTGRLDFGDNSQLLQNEDATRTTFDPFVVKFARNGDARWAESFGDANEQSASALAVGKGDQVYIGGAFTGLLGTFGGAPLGSTGADDAFVIALSEDGKVDWGAGLGDTTSESKGSSDQQITSLAVDKQSGEVVVAGLFEGAINAGQSLAALGMRDIFLMKMDDAGKTVWAKSFGSTADEPSALVAVDLAGNMVLTGDIVGAVDFGRELLSGSDNDIFIAKFFGDGTANRTPRYSDPGAQSAHAVAVDSLGNIALAGAFDTALSLGSSSIPSKALVGTDAFAAVFRP
jgi:hypothetical protein